MPDDAIKELPMEFWMLALIIAALASAPLALAALRARGVGGSHKDVAVYRDQLRDLDRDVARGVLAADEAEPVRTEISRRLLAADAAATPAETDGRGNSAWLALLLAALVLAGGFFLYDRLGAPNYGDMPLNERLAASETAAKSRPSQAEVETPADAVDIDPSVDARHLELLEKLRVALEDRPDDLQGHVMLARNEAAIGNFVGAHKAQARILAIKGDNATARDWADYADLLVMAARGYVSPEAETALKQALARDPQNGTALYYTGLMFAQNDRADRAFRIWRDLLEQGPPDAPWIRPIRAQIELAAAEAGVRYALPAAPDAPGPTAADVAAASEMSDEDRQTMIRTMVDGLAERLATEGGTPDEWARLINALGVLGDTDRAAAIWKDAQDVFAGANEALDTIRPAAERAGVAN